MRGFEGAGRLEDGASFGLVEGDDEGDQGPGLELSGGGLNLSNEPRRLGLGSFQSSRSRLDESMVDRSKLDRSMV